MSCYMQHLDWLLDNLGLEVNKANRKSVDRAIRKYYGYTEETPCPDVWNKIKSLSEEEKIELSENLRVE